MHDLAHKVSDKLLTECRAPCKEFEDDSFTFQWRQPELTRPFIIQNSSLRQHFANTVAEDKIYCFAAVTTDKVKKPEKTLKPVILQTQFQKTDFMLIHTVPPKFKKLLGSIRT